MERITAPEGSVEREDGQGKQQRKITELSALFAWKRPYAGYAYVEEVGIVLHNARSEIGWPDTVKCAK